MKPLLISLLIARSIGAFSEPTDLNPGDIAITGFNFQNPDQFSFVTFVELAEGTIIYFSDCGWKNDNTFREGEGLITYTVPAPGKKAYEVTTFPDDPGFQTEGVGGFFGFSVDGDQILAFQGSYAFPVFIFALNNNESSWQFTAIDNNTSALPSGLTNEENAIALNESVNSEYNCAIEIGDQKDLLAAMTNSSNWIDNNTNRLVLPTACFKKALPINLISFEVNVYPDYHLIKFITSNEYNVQTYELQRSENGLTYSSISSLKAINSNESTTYYYIDHYKQSCYYRLKEMDDNASILFFKPVFISRNDQEIISWFIYDLNGKVKIMGDGTVKHEEDVLSQVQLLDQGMYLIKIILSEGTITRKVYKE